MNENILVEFDEVREVVIDDVPSGYHTGEVIELPPGTHTISLTGEKNFAPEERDVTPSGTTPIQPLIVRFSRILP
jgi:hypothetical protein